MSANDRFKRGFSARFWVGLTLATLLHVAIFALSPAFVTESWGGPASPLDAVAIAEPPLPSPPEEVARPAAPVMADATVDDDPTMPPTRLEDHPPALLPPPPGRNGDLARGPTFTPMTLRPSLRNASEVARALERLYPPPLRDAGIGGTVNVWFFIDVEGRVVRTLLDESSGFDALDRAALEVADRMRFTPAEHRGERVPVWVSIPIRFEAR